MAKGNGNGNTEKRYSIQTIADDGEVFTRSVTAAGLPFWRPQDARSGHDKRLSGKVVDTITIPERDGMRAQDALVIETDGCYWIVPKGAAIARQCDEMGVGVGMKVMFVYEGKAAKAKPGQSPANRYAVYVAR